MRKQQAGSWNLKIRHTNPCLQACRNWMWDKEGHK